MGCRLSQFKEPQANVKRENQSYRESKSDSFDFSKVLFGRVPTTCHPQAAGASKAIDGSDTTYIGAEEPPTPYSPQSPQSPLKSAHRPYKSEQSSSRSPHNSPYNSPAKMSERAGEYSPAKTTEQPRRISIRSTDTATGRPRRVSEVSTVTDASYATTFRLEDLEFADARAIQISIFTGVLIAVADSGNPKLGFGSLPCNPKDTLYQCRRAVNEMKSAGDSSSALAAAVSSTLNILKRFKPALIDAGAEDGKIEHACISVAKLKEERFHVKCNQMLVTRHDIRPNLEHLQKAFAEHKWDEFGYGVGALVWLIAQDLRRARTGDV